MEPINYSIDVKSPFDSALSGFQNGMQMGAQADAMKQQQLQRAQALQMQKDLGALASNPNAGAQDYAAMMVKYPQMSEHFKKSWDVLSADQQQNKLSHATQVYAALQTGNPGVASQLLDQQATALRNSGKEEDAKAADTMSQMIQLDPTSAKTTAGLMLSSIMGPDKFASTFGTLGDQNRAQELQPSKVAQSEAEAAVTGSNAVIKGVEAANAPQKTALDNANTQSQINERPARLLLDRDKLTSEYKLKIAEMDPAFKLDDGAKKLINDSTIAAVASDQSAGQMLDLANRLEQSGAGSGATAKGYEVYKSLTGNQDAVTALRQEYVRLRSGQVSKLLPPGSASDKDIQIAMSGFPSDTTDPQTMAKFVRGMAKLQQYDGVLNTAKAEWVNSVGHLGKPKQDIEIDGVKVPAGSTFTDFTKQFMKQKVESRAAEQAVQQVRGRSYMRFAQPQGAQ
jgi:hypothetical protein